MYDTVPVAQTASSQPYLAACSSTPSTPEHAEFIRSAASLLRCAFDGNVEPLHEFVRDSRDAFAHFADLFAAAQYEVTGSLIAAATSAQALRDDVRRMASIARQVAPPESFGARQHDFAARLIAA